jgi:molecular chaperone GrpE
VRILRPYFWASLMSASRQDEMDSSNPNPQNEAPPAGDAADPVESFYTPDPRVASLEAQLAEANARAAETEARLRQVSSGYRQKVEEIDSIKDRLSRQAAVQEEIRRGEVVESLFEPVENLNRSLEAVKGTAAEEGLRIVQMQFLAALHKLGLQEVPGVGTRFDPNIHEAIATMPVTDAAQDNVVMNVFSAGFRIGSRLIRPARVIIGALQES